MSYDGALTAAGWTSVKNPPQFRVFCWL